MVASLGIGEVIITGDSSLRPLLATMKQPAGICQTMFFIDDLSATIDSSKTSATMSVRMNGAILRPSEPGRAAERHSLDRNFTLQLSDADRSALETNRTRYVRLEHEEPHSFWDSVLEPLIVVLGAAVIVALFFLIRS